jgi:spoIIIJ-associated protein
MSEQKSQIVAAGKDVDAAIAAGLTRLGLPRDAVEAEVLDEGRQGMFGLGARAARVRLTVISDEERRPSPEPKPEPKPRHKPEPQAEAAAEPRPPAAQPVAAEPKPGAQPAVPPEVEEGETAEADEEEKIRVTQQVTRGLLDAMGLQNARIEIERAVPGPSKEEVPPLVVDVSGPGTEILVGSEGEALNAFQYIVRLLVGRKMKGWVHIVVDVKGHKAQRADRLRDLAHRMADQAVDTDRTVILQPMPPHERRVVHVALYEDSRVTTESIYEGERRRVTIVPKE